MVRINYQYKVAIVFYMLIAIQVHGHNHEQYHKHPHDHDHDHHRRSRIRKASRIVNGVRTPPGQGKFMALMVKSPRENYCSAVIITGDMLLTAAHCFDDLSAADRSMMRILPNALSIQIFRDNPHIDHPLIKRIRNFWIHPLYNISGEKYDIAILQIGPLPWRLGYGTDSALMPVRLRHLDFSVIKGYGFGREVGEDNPVYLNEVNFRYYWNETHCQRMVVFHSSNNDHDVNFGVSNWSPNPRRNPAIYRNAGEGDSGGGIFIKGSVRRVDRSTNRNIIKMGFVLAGIIIGGSNYSIAIANLNKQYFTYAVNVTTMMPWINSIVRVDFETYPFPILSTMRIG